MRRFFADRPAMTWFGLTFLISWGGILAVGAPAGFPAPAADAEALFPATLGVMLAGPILAAVLTAAVVDGWSGVRAWLIRFTEWRVPAGWYLAALLPVPIIAGVLGLFASVRPEYVPALASTDDPVGLLLAGLAVGAMAGLFEEPGWTGFALPALRERHGVLASGLILGVAWGTWHLLVTAWASGDADGRFVWELFVGPTAFYVGVLPMFRVAMVWVQDRCPSLPIAGVMHGGLTATTVFVLAPGVEGWPLVAYYVALTLVGWVVLVPLLVRPSGGPA